MRFSNGQFLMCSLGNLACWYPQAHRCADFLDIALEYAPEDSGLESMEANSPEAAALIRASRMRLQLRAAAAPGAAPEHAPPRRRVGI